MEIPASYKGREQAFVKHTLLKSYLERLFMIVGQHAKKNMLCRLFCRPVARGWHRPFRYVNRDFSKHPTEKSRLFLRGLVVMDVQFRALYIEKD